MSDLANKNAVELLREIDALTAERDRLNGELAEVNGNLVACEAEREDASNDRISLQEELSASRRRESELTAWCFQMQASGKRLLDVLAGTTNTRPWQEGSPLACHERALYGTPYEALAPVVAALKGFATDEWWHINGPCDPNGPNFKGQTIAQEALKHLGE